MNENPVDMLIKFVGLDVSSLSADELNELDRARAYCEEPVPTYTSVDLLRGSRPNGDFPSHKNCKECGTA